MMDICIMVHFPLFTRREPGRMKDTTPIEGLMIKRDKSVFILLAHGPWE